MFHEISELHMVQADGAAPTPLAAGSAPGESGVFVFKQRFERGGHVSERRLFCLLTLVDYTFHVCIFGAKPVRLLRVGQIPL